MNVGLDQPPNTIDFSKLKKAQLQAYKDWFMASIDGRIAGLHAAVTSLSAFQTWKPDFRPGSLKLLGEWFLKNVETRSRTESEIQAIKRSTPYDFGVLPDTLTKDTFWLAVDIGMYFGKTFASNFPQLSWVQYLESKRSIDFGHICLAGFGRMTMNPIHLMTVVAHGFSRGSHGGTRVHEVYCILEKKVSPE